MAQAVPIVLGALQLGESFVNKGKLKEEAALLEKNKPIKRTSQFNNDALALSESELANGMSAGAEKAYNDSTDRSLSSSISALLKGGGSVNNVGDIYDSSEQGRQNLALMQDQMRLAHIQGVLKQYDTQANEEEKNWMVNQYGPYKDKLQALGEQRKANAQLATAGLNTFGSGLMNFLGGDSALKGAFGDGTKTLNPSSLSAPLNTPQQPIPNTQAQPLQNTLNPNNNNYLANGSLPSNDAWSNFWNNYQMKF